MPEWLWVAFVRRMLDEGWNVGTTKDHAGRLKGVADPPDWVDRDALAEAIVEGELRPGDVARMVKVAADASAKIAQASTHALTSLVPYTRHLAELHAGPRWLWPALVHATRQHWRIAHDPCRRDFPGHDLPLPSTDRSAR